MAADGSIIINTRLNTDGFREGTADMKKSFAGLSGSLKKLGGAIAGVFAVKALWEFGKSAIELGSDLQEVQNVVDSVFTTMSKRVDEFAKNAAVTAGLSETMAKKYTGTFGAMAKSFGFAESEAFDMSTALTQLTGDVASFYNLTQDEAYTKLKSVFTGETESLKELGVVMTQSALDAYAMANGFGKTTAAMSEQEKVALRYQFVMNQLSTASGDFIRTADGWANQVRVLKLQVDSLKATIGSGLINLFTPVIKVINILLAKLATVANAFKSFTELITGNKSSGPTSSANAGLDASVYNDMADGAQGVADATDNITKSTKKAEKAQNSYLSGLDEIRRFGEENVSTGAGGGAAGGIGAGIGNVNYGTIAEGETVFEKTETAIDRVLKRLKDLQKLLKKGFWDGLGDYKPILEEMKQDVSSIGDSLHDIFTSNEVVNSASRFADTFVYSLGKVSGSFSNIGLNIASLLVGGLESYLSKNESRISGFIARMFDIGSEISVIAADISSAFSDIIAGFTGQEGQNLLGSIIGIFTEIWLGIFEILAKISTDVLDMLVQPFVQHSGTIKTTIENTLAALQPFVDFILVAVQNFLDSLNEFINGPFAEMKANVIESLSSIMEELLILWNQVVIPLLKWLEANVLPVITPIIDKIIKTVFSLLTAVTGVVDGNILQLKGLISFITGIFTGDWKKAFKGMQDIAGGFEKQIGSIFGFIKDSVLGTFIDFMKYAFEKDWSESFGKFGKVMNDFFDDVELGWETAKGFFNDIVSFIKNIFAGNWKSAWEFVVNIFKGVFERLVNFAKAPINNVIGLINGLIGLLNDVIYNIEDAFSFSYDFTGPFGKRHTGYFGLDLPNVPTIPYLATGAIIPPNAPFFAMLGDQKNGTNLEAPEGLIRQIMREELANNPQGGGQYTFVGQINRRTLFEEFIEEAKIVMSQTGNNPFDIA